MEHIVGSRWTAFCLIGIPKKPVAYIFKNVNMLRFQWMRWILVERLAEKAATEMTKLCRIGIETKFHRLDFVKTYCAQLAEDK